MVKPTCMATWNYTKPSKGGHSSLKGKLKYMTFREDAHHVTPENGRERWVEGGLGGSWREVYTRCQALAGPYVLAHHFVLAPDPDLMALVPEAQRRTLLAELTINTLVDWHQARDLPAPEMSFVIHDRETTDERAPGRQMLHSHAFCAGTLPTLEGRTSVMVKERDVVRNKGGLARETNLNHFVEQNWGTLLDRTIGPSWRLARERLNEQLISASLPPSVEAESAPPNPLARRDYPTLGIDI